MQKHNSLIMCACGAGHREGALLFTHCSNRQELTSLLREQRLLGSARPFPLGCTLALFAWAGTCSIYKFQLFRSVAAAHVFLEMQRVRLRLQLHPTCALWLSKSCCL